LPVELGFVVGAMVAATDPAAVVATFRRVSAPKRLVTVVESESLLNDGTALVVFAIALQAVASGFSWPTALLAFVVTVAGSILIGGVIGWLASRVVATVNDHLIELTISLATAYGAYLVADLAHESGIIATVVAGAVLGTYGRRIGMSDETQQALDIVWEFLAFLLTALAFLLVGLAISVPDLFDALAPIAWCVLAITVGRVIVVYLLLGGSSRLVSDRFHPALPVAWLHVLFWAGLRGAVAVAMALSLPPDLPQRDLLRDIVFGVVLFTLLIQGTTTELVIRRSGAATTALTG
jgi:CPA1 family monovalent cation:H+ antiporter